VAPSHQGERCEGSFFDVGPEWTEVGLDVGVVCAGLPWLDSLTFDLAGADVVLTLDHVRFE
jgi:hypothetical protein